MTDQLKTKYSQEMMNSAYNTFLEQFDGYDPQHIDHFRSSEFGRLDRSGQVYLDYTGGGLYANSQIDKHMEILKKGVYGNPHSSNPTSFAMTELDEHARQYIFDFFNADPDEYVVIFTPNASGALKLVGESYPFDDNGNYLLTFDNHNSVNGIREFAKAHGAKLTYSPIVPPDMRLDEEKVREYLETLPNPEGSNLFAFPAQSNFSGVQHNLDLIEVAHDLGWDVLLDGAAFAPTNRLDLSKYKPDFVTLSFYKIFGYPTGVGALIARREVLSKLRRPWFAGGTISLVSVQANDHFMADNEAAFEDGTINYLTLPAIEIGLSFINQIGIEKIHYHVESLVGWLLQQMSALKHSNGKPLFSIYGPLDTTMRGGTVASNLYDAEGNIFDFRYVEYMANQSNISLRTGCFCNPGAGELALHMSPQDMIDTFANNERMSYDQFVEVMTMRGDNGAAGSVRISVGLATNFADVFNFMKFVEETFIDKNAKDIIVPVLHH